MANLDYAFLADYASVQGGLLTAVGASFTHIDPKALGQLYTLSVAGRIRAGVDEPPSRLNLEIKAPDSSFLIRGEFELLPDESVRPYRGKVGVLFAATSAIWLSVPGLYEVNLSLNGKHVRRLAFDVSE